MNFFKSKFVMMALTLATILPFPTAVQAGLYDTELQQLYVAYFGRPADTTGLAYWNSIVEAATNAGQDSKVVLASIASTFIANPEFNGANQTGLQNINKIYNNMFGRAPDAAGLLYWSTLLQNGRLTLPQIVQAMADGAVASGDTTFANKTAAAVAFTEGVDTTTKILGYSGAAAGNLAKAFIAGITDTASLKAATETAALNATIQTVTDAGNAPPPPPPLDNAGAVNAVNKAFVAVLGRPPSPAELSNWVSQTDGNKMTIVDAVVKIGIELAKTPEFKTASVGTGTGPDLVKQLSKNMFGSSHNTSLFPKVLSSNIGEILRGLQVSAVNGVETFVKKEVLDIFDNKVAVAAAFTKAIDTPEERAKYQGETNNQRAVAFLAGITDDKSRKDTLVTSELNRSIALLLYDKDSQATDIAKDRVIETINQSVQSTTAQIIQNAITTSLKDGGGIF